MPEGDADTGGTKVAALTADDLARTVTMKVDGQDRTLTVKQVMEGYSLAEASHARMREASELATSVANDTETAKMFGDALKSGDGDKLRDACQRVGLEQEHIDRLFAPAESDAAGPAGAGDDGDDAQSPRVAALEAAVVDLAARQKRTDDTILGAQRAGTDRGRSTQVKTLLDSDPEMAQYLERLDDDSRKEVYQMAYDVALLASKTQSWGPRTMQLGLDRAKKRLQAFGAGRADDDTREGDSAHGLGPASLAVPQLHRKAGEPELVSVRDKKGWCGSFGDRMRAIMSKGTT